MICPVPDMAHNQSAVPTLKQIFGSKYRGVLYRQKDRLIDSASCYFHNSCLLRLKWSKIAKYLLTLPTTKFINYQDHKINHFHSTAEYKIGTAEFQGKRYESLQQCISSNEIKYYAFMCMSYHGICLCASFSSSLATSPPGSVMQSVSYKTCCRLLFRNSRSRNFPVRLHMTYTSI